MTIQEFFDATQAGLIGFAIVLLGLIRIPKIDINLWTVVARLLGRTINGEMIEKINDMDRKLEKHIERTEEERANQARQRILRFCDEILLEKGHSREHYDEILSDIDKYEAYCNTHSDFVNNKAVLAIHIIKDAYQDCVENHDFLVYTKKQ